MLSRRMTDFDSLQTDAAARDDRDDALTLYRRMLSLRMTDTFFDRILFLFVILRRRKSTKNLSDDELLKRSFVVAQDDRRGCYRAGRGAMR